MRAAIFSPGGLCVPGGGLRVAWIINAGSINTSPFRSSVVLDHTKRGNSCKPVTGTGDIASSEEEGRRCSVGCLTSAQGPPYNTKCTEQYRFRCVPGWRNWQTRTFEGRVVNTIRVQVSSRAPLFRKAAELAAFFFVVRAAHSGPVVAPGSLTRARRPCTYRHLRHMMVCDAKCAMPRAGCGQHGGADWS